MALRVRTLAREHVTTMIRKSLVLLVVVGLGVSSAHAEPIVLGDGLVYDPEQNLTWLQDVMYASTSGFDADGRMTYDEAAEWADRLEYGGFSDWRLPQVYSGGWWWGSDSEVSRLLGQLGWQWSYEEGSTIPDYVQGATGPFLNFPANTLWLGPNLWWSRYYSTDGADLDWSRAWAVRSGGPVGVPEPSTLLLLGSGLALGLLRNHAQARTPAGTSAAGPSAR